MPLSAGQSKGMSPGLRHYGTRLNSRRFRFERESMMRAFTLVLLAGTVLLSACNTIEGAGKDVSSVGRTVARTADGAK